MKSSRPPSPPAPADKAAAPETMSAALHWLQLARHDLDVRGEALARLQTDLDAEQERYAALFKTSPDGYFITDAQGVIREVNRVGAAQLHIPGPQLIGKPLVNYVAMDDRQNLRRRLVLQKEGKHSADPASHAENTGADDASLVREQIVEFARMVPRHAPSFEALLRITVLFNSRTGTMDGLQWLVSDVTQRVRAETERYRLLVDAVEEYAVFLLDETGRITSWNRGAEKTFGWRERDVLGQNYAFVFSPEHAHIAEREIAAARADGRYSEEGWMIGKNGRLFWTQGVLLSLHTSHSGGERAGFAKILRDMTDKRREAEELKLREARLSLALQAARAASWEWNAQTGEMFWSGTYWEMTGLDAEQDAPSYTNWKRSVHPDDWPGVEQKFASGIADTTPVSVEYRAVLKTGATRWLMSLGQPVAGDNKTARMVGVLLDITERKEAQAVLEARVKERTHELAQANHRIVRETTARHDLMQKIVTAQEDERRRISRELHDTMGQHLTAFSLNLRVLEDAQPESVDTKPILTRLRQVAAELSHDLHQMAMDLRPTALDDLGLVHALRGYVENWKDRTGIAAQFGASGFAPRSRRKNSVNPAALSAVVETILYRIVQEALNNVARHSGATRADVTLSRHDDTVVLVIEDNGRGFDAERVLSTGSSRPKPPEGETPAKSRRKTDGDGQKSGRLGVLGMAERAQTVGGTFTLESTPGGGGTSVFVRVPLGSLGPLAGI